MTLLEITKECLELNGKTINDIKWVGNQNFHIDINDFIRFSKNLNLEICRVDSVDLNTLPTDLVVVGDDFWLARPILYTEDCRYLSDVWIFNAMPEMPDTVKKIRTLSAKYLPKNEEWERFNVTLDDLAEK